jgi:hypothetical protein
VPRELRPYLPLLLESLLELAVKRDSVLVPYEEVVAQLETDTITTSTGIGLEALSRFQCGPYSHTASLMIQVVMCCICYGQGLWKYPRSYHSTTDFSRNILANGFCLVFM